MKKLPMVANAVKETPVWLLLSAVNETAQSAAFLSRPFAFIAASEASEKLIRDGLGTGCHRIELMMVAENLYRTANGGLVLHIRQVNGQAVHGNAAKDSRPLAVNMNMARRANHVAEIARQAVAIPGADNANVHFVRRGEGGAITNAFPQGKLTGLQ
jgi:hypothetical protein